MMTCEHCGAPLRLDANRGLMVCDYCQSEVIPPADEDGVSILEETKFDCPVCHAKLQNGSLEHFPLLYCRECHGMLVAMDDLEALVVAVRSHRGHRAAYVSPRIAIDGQRTLRCPRCGETMDDHPYGGAGNVNVDSCESCASVWLDKGGLQKIAAAPDDESIYLDYGDGGKR